MISTIKYQMVVVAGLSALAAGVLVTSGRAKSASLLQVTSTSDANTLANTISGSGVAISGATYTGAPQAAGVFSNGNAAGLGIDSGILQLRVKLLMPPIQAAPPTYQVRITAPQEIPN